MNSKKMNQNRVLKMYISYPSSSFRYVSSGRSDSVSSHSGDDSAHVRQQNRISQGPNKPWVMQPSHIHELLHLEMFWKRLLLYLKYLCFRWLCYVSLDSIFCTWLVKSKWNYLWTDDLRASLLFIKDEL